jgi:mono/diheme cytochrome c family protein
MTRRAILHAVWVSALIGCQQQMARQPAYHWPDQPSDFFPDGRATRPIDPETVARGQLRDDAGRFTGQDGPGKADAPNYVTEFPYPVTEAMLHHGRERFNIFCAVCHGRTGEGDGKVVQRGYARPPSYHDPRLRAMPVGRFFEVITRGHGAMPDHAEQIPTDDRWAIIAYVRALQLSQNVPASELTEEEKVKLREAEERRKKSDPTAEGRNGH